MRAAPVGPDRLPLLHCSDLSHLRSRNLGAHIDIPLEGGRFSGRKTMDRMPEFSIAMLTLFFATVILVAALGFDDSHGRQEELRTIALFQQAVDRAQR